MSLARRTPFVCRSCTLELRARIAPKQSLLSARSYATAPNARGDKPFRLAVIGSGPAGFYSAYRVMNKIPDAVVDMYEQLPVPFGLVRFGVAPDHPEVKKCQEKFEEVAASPRFNFVGNVNIGHDVPLKQLVPHYDAVLFSYGASYDKKLGVPGEDLEGVYSARAFVGWYNGLPEFADLDPKLDAGEEAVIIGQGNVSLDVARILLCDLGELRKTDIAEHAASALSKSRVKSVKIVGRRGPWQAAFSNKEARELFNLPGAHFAPLDESFFPGEADAKALSRPQQRLLKMFKSPAKTPAEVAAKNWTFKFLLSPTSFNLSSTDPSSLSSVTFTKNAFDPPTPVFAKDASVVATPESEVLPASVAFRSVGYKSAKLPEMSDIGVPFNDRRGVIPNDGRGRVVDPASGPGELTAMHLPGLYCAGWVKNGPTGVIATTMDDAFATADTIVQDWAQQAKFIDGDAGGWDALRHETKRRGLRTVSWEDWKKIDETERAKGKELGKERAKFVNKEDMLKVLDA
ncbi:NADPH:adrenodoxin oxidoreductase mitochondrial precursor [Phyllosticta citrichinensis]